MTSDNGPHTGIRLALQKIDLSTAEEQAVSQWLKIYMNEIDVKKRNVSGCIDVMLRLTGLVEATGLDEPSLQILREGLDALTGVIFTTRREGDLDVAVPQKAEGGDPSALIEALGDEDIAVAQGHHRPTAPTGHPRAYRASRTRASQPTAAATALPPIPARR